MSKKRQAAQGFEAAEAAGVRGLLGDLDSLIKVRRDQGHDYTVNFNGRPHYTIDSLDPLVYRRNGAIFDRAPEVAGQLSVRGVLMASSLTDERITQPVMVMATPNEQMYGVRVGVETLNALAELVVGKPGPYFTQG